jgi:hypothetical protein
MLKDVPEYRDHVDFYEIIERFQYQSHNKCTPYLRPKAAMLLHELEKIMLAQSNTRHRLQALRQRVKYDQITLERVKVATSQAKAQAIVCVILYLGLIVYIANTRSSFFKSIWFVISLLLFFLGLFLMQRLSQLAIRVKI